MYTLIAQAAEAVPLVQMDGPETALTAWAGILTILLTRLWVRSSKSETVQSGAAYVSPNITSKISKIASEADQIAQDLADGTVPTDRIAKRAASLASLVGKAFN